ncbi:RagB/SusD family nutrient uptake outer membrane protein [Prevotella cerevisiae]|uniref:RagB/SusD family nutrient uptake outer membrane protein n=1 Tax=Segatella cerevisiae TaxID=2053716 RepID=A0ABT1BX45_9BACT|nr:RagB/SusD family nutrient uptake outer membrane protein [Segatella cerevisiae]MCO6025647.1 RagB/SusD family nutrient uptake outer membrane protein [Segatella cerevisiae]
MKKIFAFTLFLSAAFSLTSCSGSFLDQEATSTLTDDYVQQQEQIEGLVTSAYAGLGNDHYTYPFNLWPYGDVRSDDAKKGGRDETDCINYHFLEISEGVNSSTDGLDQLWYHLYIGIKRCNVALQSLELPANSNYPNKAEEIAEMKFLRAHFYYKLKILFKFVPWITEEDIDKDDYATVGNRIYSNEDLWKKIIADFEDAYNALPATQSQVARPTKYAAAAYLAKCYSWLAYPEGDDTNTFTGTINATYMQKVLDYANIVINSGKYALQPDFASNFLPTADGGIENGVESIWSIQFSRNDGTKFGRLNWGNALNWPQGCGGCDFHKPSQDLVNAYKTVNGLPDFDHFEDKDYDYTTKNSEVDPRLYHTVAMPGYPYKYDTDTIYKKSWIRNEAVYGDYASLKECCSPNSTEYIKIDPFYATTIDQIELRFADILLLKAEAEIELNSNIPDAMSIINQIRTRAGNSQSMSLIKGWATNCKISTYPTTGVSQDYARTALRWERRLEFAMEGQRFFDLVRWGIAKSTLNNFYKHEVKISPYYSNAKFDTDHDEYCPIPYNQIYYAGGVDGVYKQNPGY